MVCGAPTSCSSGGRSAVHTPAAAPVRGGPRPPAGCSSTAAVPLVVSTTLGRPVAEARPRAMKPADRSSWWTCTAKAVVAGEGQGQRRRPRARGDDGVGDARARTHSSTRVAQKVAAAVTGQVAVVHPHSLRLRPMAARLDTEVHGRGARVGLVHGFTQNRRCWGAFADRLAEQFEVVLVDAPGHGGRPRSRPTWPRAPRSSARPWDARAISGTPWVVGTPCGWRSIGPTSSNAWCSSAPRPVWPTPASASSGVPPTTRWRLTSSRSVSRRSSTNGWRNRCSPASQLRPVPGRTPNEHGGGVGGQPAPRRHRRAGAVVGPVESPLRVPTLLVVGARRPQVLGHGESDDPRAIGANAARRR